MAPRPLCVCLGNGTVWANQNQNRKKKIKRRTTAVGRVGPSQERNMFEAVQGEGGALLSMTWEMREVGGSSSFWSIAHRHGQPDPMGCRI